MHAEEMGADISSNYSNLKINTFISTINFDNGKPLVELVSRNTILFWPFVNLAYRVLNG